MKIKKSVKYCALIFLVCIAFISALLIVAKYFKAKETVSYNEIIKAEVSSSISVFRDVNGIPLIRADTMEDALFALGYVHAQDGIVIGEYYRAIANGMLSSLVGEKALVIDKLSRSLNFREKAEKLFRKLDKKYANYFDAYTKGLNLFLKKSYDNIAAVARIGADEWKAEDVIAILLMLDWYYSFLQNRELVFVFYNKNLTNEMKKIFPPSLTSIYNDSDRNNVMILKELQEAVRKFVGAFNRGCAFYLPSTITADEKAALGYNIESLGTTYPLWYPVRMEIKGKSIVGITAIGMPYIFSGKNEKFAFVGFNLSIDVQDFYKEISRKGGRGTEFLFGGRWVEIPTRDEKIEILKNEHTIETMNYQVRWKYDCAIISDVFKAKIPSDIISVRGIDPSSDYIKFLFELPFSDDMGQASRLVTNVVSIPKVYIFASEERGNIIYMGAIPRRNVWNVVFQRGDIYGVGISFFNISAYLYEERRKPVVVGSEMLSVLPYPLQNYGVFNDVWRFERINELIKDRLTQPHLISNILHDTESQIAKRFTPLYHNLLEKIPIPSARLSKIYFKNWDFLTHRNSVPTTILHVVLERFFFETIFDDLNDDAHHAMEHYYWALHTFAEIARNENALAFDDITTEDRVETRSMIFDRAFLYTLKYLNNNFGPYMNEWKWGRLHRAKLAVPLLKKKSLVRKELMKTYLYKVSGDDSTVLHAPIDVNNRYRAKSITALSAVFYKGSFISRSVSASINPLSEFSEFFMDNRNFVDFENSAIKYEMKINPLK